MITFAFMRTRVDQNGNATHIMASADQFQVADPAEGEYISKLLMFVDGKEVLGLPLVVAPAIVRYTGYATPE